MQIHFLKIIWGDAIILKDGDHVGMIDTAEEKHYEQIRDYLYGLGVQKLDFILLTHFHLDHYGSLKKLVKNFQVDKVYFKEYSALDKSTAGGKVADDEYRNHETAVWMDIKASIEKLGKDAVGTPEYIDLTNRLAKCGKEAEMTRMAARMAVRERLMKDSKAKKGNLKK